jgi:cytosine/adenosine deaminase-related metal-dependent hydrolase
MADVLAAATLGGATALGMADRIESLRAGSQADIVLLGTDAVSTAGAHDPVGMVVNAHPGVVDTVLVAGRVVKRDGRLLHPRVGEVVAAANGVRSGWRRSCRSLPRRSGRGGASARSAERAGGGA